MDGVLILDKPEGLTSHDVVAAVRRLLPRGTKVGHTGTLDPFATGVLPIVVGRATRLARFLSGDDKRYRATVAFGVSTTTCDSTGEVVGTADQISRQALTHDIVAAALARFVGTHAQVPPVFSAKKVAGERAYERARRGETTPPPAVTVTAHSLVLVAFDAADVRAVIDVTCSAGYYVRALARDLGASVGVPAHLHALRRTAAGPFDEQSACPLADLLREPVSESLRARLRPMGTLLTHMPGVTVTDDERRAVGHGRALMIPASRVEVPATQVEGPGRAWTGGHVRLLDAAGNLLALAIAEAAPGTRVSLQPDVVLTGSDASGNADASGNEP